MGLVLLFSLPWKLSRDASFALVLGPTPFGVDAWGVWVLVSLWLSLWVSKSGSQLLGTKEHLQGKSKAGRVSAICFPNGFRNFPELSHPIGQPILLELCGIGSHNASASVLVTENPLPRSLEIASLLIHINFEPVLNLLVKSQFQSFTRLADSKIFELNNSQLVCRIWSEILPAHSTAVWDWSIWIWSNSVSSMPKEKHLLCRWASNLLWAKFCSQKMRKRPLLKCDCMQLVFNVIVEPVP